MKVAYSGFFADSSGFGEAARRSVMALVAAGADVRPGTVFMDGGWQIEPDDALMAFLQQKPHEQPDVHVIHAAAKDFPEVAAMHPGVKVGMTCWETNKLHPSAVKGTEAVAGVIVPSVFCASVFKTAGFRATVVPYPLTKAEPEPVEPLDLIPEDTFVFYSVLTWQERKNPLALLTAYAVEFGTDEKVMLVLKVGGENAQFAIARAQEDVQRHLDAMNLPNPPDIRIVGGQMTPGQLAAFHRRGQCYVSLARGEAFGIPMFDAFIQNRAVVATGWSGPIDYLCDNPHPVFKPEAFEKDGVYLVASVLTPVVQQYPHFAADQAWAQPDIYDAAAMMRRAYSEWDWLPDINRDTARWQPAAVGRALLDAMKGFVDGH